MTARGGIHAFVQFHIICIMLCLMSLLTNKWGTASIDINIFCFQKALLPHCATFFLLKNNCLHTVLISCLPSLESTHFCTSYHARLCNKFITEQCGKSIKFIARRQCGDSTQGTLRKLDMIEVLMHTNKNMHVLMLLHAVKEIMPLQIVLCVESNVKFALFIRFK